MATDDEQESGESSVAPAKFTPLRLALIATPAVLVIGGIAIGAVALDVGSRPLLLTSLYGALPAAWLALFAATGVVGLHAWRTRKATTPDPMARLVIAIVLLGVDWLLVLASSVVAWLGMQLGAVAISAGRPLRILGRQHLAARRSDKAWDNGEKSSISAPPGAREALVAHWEQAAFAEHASIPAFARLSLDLTAVGAPPDLLERAHQAAIDEIDHTRRCLAVARALGGEPGEPGELTALQLAEMRRVNLGNIAFESLRDGCGVEGTAALVAAAARDAASDPVVRAHLEVIAADEARHLALAEDIVRWCCQREPEVVEVVRRGLPRLEAELRTHDVDPALAALGLGVVDEATQVLCAQRALKRAAALVNALERDVVA